MLRFAPATSLVLFLLLPATASAAPTERRVYSNDADASSAVPTRWEGFVELGNPNYALDDDPATAWVEASPGSGAGEWLRVDIAPLDKTTKVKLKIRNGCQKSKDTFAQNARAKDVTIRLLPAGIDKKVTLTDKDGWQDVLAEQPAGSFTGVELRIASVYEGEKTKDLCISDVQVTAASEVASVPGFEAQKQKALAEWRTTRAAYAKVAAKKPLPLHESYDIVTKDLKAPGTGFLSLIAAAEADPTIGKDLKYAVLRAKKLVTELATVQRATYTLKPSDKLAAVDGVQIPTFNDIAEGEFDTDAFRMPMLAGSGILFRDQLAVTDAKDKLTPDDWMKQKTCGGDASWVVRGDSTGMDKLKVIEALVVARCANVVGRGSATTRVHREREIYIFGPEGQVVLVVAESHVEGYKWGLENGKPMIVGARSLLATKTKVVDARMHEDY